MGAGPLVGRLTGGASGLHRCEGRGGGGGAWVHARHSSSQTGLRQSRPAAEKMRLVMRLAHRHFPAGWAAHAFLWSTVNVLTLSRISRTGVGIRAAFQKDTGAMFRDRCR